MNDESAKIFIDPKVMLNLGYMKVEEHKQLLKRFANELIEFTGRRDAVVWVARSFGVDMEK